MTAANLISRRSDLPRPVAAARLRRTGRIVLQAYVIVLLLFPSNLVVAPLGAAGTPAGILAVGLLMWWLLGLLNPGPKPRWTNPVTCLLIVFVICMLASYVVGMTRPIADAIEVSSADRTLIALLGWCGVTLATMDGISRWRDLERVLRLLSICGAVVAVLGMLQFFLNWNIASTIHVPGLVTNVRYDDVIARSDFRRVTGTTIHPIEFGVVISSIVPFAIHCARFARTRSTRVVHWICVILMVATLPMSVARSAILGAFIVLVTMYPSWPRRFRRRTLMALVVGALAFSVVVPGLLGTLRSLFLNVNSDPSTQGRTADYQPVFDYWLHAPVLGRGLGTFLPELYRTLDNQYLGLLVETGLLGLLSTLAMFGGTAIASVSARRRARKEPHRDLGQCLLAAILALSVNTATFDLFGFPMAVGCLFLLIGIAGCYWDLMRPPSAVQERLPRGRTMWLPALVMALSMVVLAGVVSHRQVSYESYAAVVFEGPTAQGAEQFSSVPRASAMTWAVYTVLEDHGTREHIARTTVGEYAVAIGDGSLKPGTDRQGAGSVLHIAARSTSAELSAGLLTRVQDRVLAELAQLQEAVGVPRSEWIQSAALSASPPHAVAGRRTRSVAVGLMLSTILAAVAWELGSRRARRRRSGTGKDIRVRESS